MLSIAGPTPVNWGRYNKKGHTLESLLFFHPSYVLWILREFPSNDLIRQRLKDLIAEANKRPVLVFCDRKAVNGHPCERVASFVSVAGEGLYCNVKGGLNLCGHEECRQTFLANAQGGIHFYRLSFDGLQDLARSNVPNSRLDHFVKLLALSWGIVKPEQMLTKEAVYRFFYGNLNRSET